jgi:DNA-binding NarL/FixJ family response regulator
MTRAEDDKTLRMLDLHQRGHSAASIARALNMTRTAVQNRISRVVTEDCLHDPTAAAWWQATRRRP